MMYEKTLAHPTRAPFLSSFFLFRGKTPIPPRTSSLAAPTAAAAQHAAVLGGGVGDLGAQGIEAEPDQSPRAEAIKAMVAVVGWRPLLY